MEEYQRNSKVLYVDDEEALLISFKSLFRKEPVEIHVLQDSTQIEAVLEREGPFAVVFSDQRMPKLDGVGVLEAVARHHPLTVRALITGYADLSDTLRAINLAGITSYIPKPWKDDQLRSMLREFVDRYNLAGQNQFLLAALQEANNSLHELLDGTVTNTVRLLGDMIEAVNPDAASRRDRIRKLGKAYLDMSVEITDDERRDILIALDLCFLGIAVLPPWIQVSLNKQGLLALDRFDVARNHQLLAANLVKDIPRFQNVARILRLQAKDLDGNGVPATEHVSGEGIPLGSRLLHILVELEKRTSEAFKGRQVLEKMLAQSTKFDTRIVARMLNRADTRAAKSTDIDLGLSDLRPGMVVLEDVTSATHQCLLRAGVALSEMSINLLRQWNEKDSLPERIRVRIQD
jgi:response regulator RpfG family c-di-GMP phosphodiesterase